LQETIEVAVFLVPIQFNIDPIERIVLFDSFLPRFGIHSPEPFCTFVVVDLDNESVVGFLVTGVRVASPEAFTQIDVRMFKLTIFIDVGSNILGQVWTGSSDLVNLSLLRDYLTSFNPVTRIEIGYVEDDVVTSSHTVNTDPTIPRPVLVAVRIDR
jgi:hypothetical protein